MIGGVFIRADVLSAAGSYVNQNFGYGYSIAVIFGGVFETVFELRAPDGSLRMFMLDRALNVELAPDGVTDETSWMDWYSKARDKLGVIRREQEGR